MKILLLLLALLVPASAQELPNHSVAIGAGAGAVGLKSAGPCSPGQTLIWTSSTSDPACTNPNAFNQGPYYVSDVGSDSNSCLSALDPCLTIQHAVNLCGPSGTGINCNVNVADGLYHAGAAATYYSTINVSGPLDGGGNCISRAGVIIDDGGVQKAIFDAEDHVTFVINCMSINLTANGSVAMSSRQYSIVDMNNVNYQSSNLNVSYLAITENSKANILNPGLFGGAVVWAQATQASQLTVGGTVSGDNPAFSSSFIAIADNAILLYQPIAQTTGVMVTSALICTNSIVNGLDKLFTIAATTAFTNIDCVLHGFPQTNFRVNLTADHTNATGDGTVYQIPFNSATWDNASSVNLSTGAFSPAYTSNFLCTGQVQFSNLGAGHNVAAIKLINNAGQTYEVWRGNPFALDAGGVTQSFAVTITANLGDIIAAYLAVAGSTKTVTVNGASSSAPVTSFSCFPQTIGGYP